MVAILGAKYPGERIVNKLKSKNVNVIFVTPSLRDIKFKKKLSTHKVIHYIGSPTVTFLGLLTLIRFKIWKKKILVTWRGSDVLIANTKPIFRFFTKTFQPLIDVNTALSEALVEELNGIGIKAKLQPNPVYTLYELQELPSEKKVAVYLPDKLDYQWNFYQGNMIKKLVNEFPEVSFIIIGNKGKNFTEKNVKCLGWVENTEEIYKQVRAVVRLPLHDGLSNTILEATSMGRTVIASSVNFSFCKIANNYEEVKKHLHDTLEKPILNVEGSKFVHKNYDCEKITNELISIYNELEVKEKQYFLNSKNS